MKSEAWAMEEKNGNRSFPAPLKLIKKAYTNLLCLLEKDSDIFDLRFFHLFLWTAFTSNFAFNIFSSADSRSFFADNLFIVFIQIFRWAAFLRFMCVCLIWQRVASVRSRKKRRVERILCRKLWVCTKNI